MTEKRKELKIKVRTTVRAGGWGTNHNATRIR
jgi:hypothetical protein